MKSILTAVFLLFVSLNAQAAQYDIKQMTPEVSQAIANRQSRYDRIQALKSTGRIGENKSGYIEALDGFAEAQSLAEQENRDRKVIYQTIAEQNNLGAAGFNIIESVFAEVQREKTQPGESMQLPSGEWVKK